MPVKDTKLQWRNKVLVGLQELVADMIGELDLQVILQKAVERMAELVGADIVTIHIYDPPTSRVRAAAGYGLRDKETFQQHKPGRGKVALRVTRRDEPVIAEDVSASELAGPFSAREGVQSAAGFPLKVGDKVIGVLFVNYREPHKFEPEEVETLVSFGNLAAVAINNARLFNQTQEQVKQLSALVKTGQVINRPIDLISILEPVFEQAFSLVGKEVGWIALVDRETQILRIVASRGIPKESIDVFHKRPTYAYEGTFGLVMQTGEIQEFPDAKHDERVLDLGLPIPEQLANIPLKVEGQVIGILTLDALIPNEQARQSLLVLAGMTAVAIDKARLFEQNAGLIRSLKQRNKELQALNKIGQAVSAKGVEEVLKLVYEQTSQLMDTTNFFICLYDRDKEELHFEIWMHEGRSLEKFSDTLSGSGLTGWVIQENKPLSIRDWDEEESSFPVKAGIVTERQRSWLGVPLLVGEEVIGVMSVQSPHPNAFDLDTQQLLEIIANQAAVAIRNAWLFQQRETLQHIACDITSVLDGDKLLQRTLERSLELLNCQFGSISIFDPKSNTLQVRYAVGRPPDMTVEFGQGLVSVAAETRKPVRVGDVSRDERCVCRVEETKSELDVPMLAGDRLIGVLNAESQRLNAFSEEDQHLAEALAAQAAVAFCKAELYAETQARLQERVDDTKALQDIYALIGTAPLEDVLERIAKEAARLTPAKYAEVWLLDEPARELQFGARNKVETEEGTTQDLPALSLRETSINARVALTRETYLCSDIEGDPYYKARYKDTRSELTTPLIHSERVIGILNLESTEVGAFTDDHERLVEALAGAAAVAIQNARLYESIRTLNEVGRALTRGIRLKQDEVLELIYGQASKLINTDNMYIALYDEATDTVRFGLAFVDGRRVDVGKEEGWQPRKGGEGRTEEIIRTGKPILIATKAEAEYWYRMPEQKEYVERTFTSWLGVPMMVGDKVLGGIAAYHPTWNYMYSGDDLEVLQAIADQAAIALDNAEQVQSRIEAERRAYLADLAQTTAHHLKNELGSIRPMAEIMIEDADLDLPADYRKSLEMICTNASNAERLVARLFAPFRDLKLGQIGVDWLISETKNSASPLLGGIEIVDSCPQSLPAVHVDRLGTVGVFAELLTNAQEAIRRGSRPGRIDVIASLSKDQGWVEVQFTNNGPPIPPQLQEVLFQPRKEVETSGFGLGLWSARILLEREGGSIHLLKSDKESTTFLVRLPVLRQEV